MKNPKRQPLSHYNKPSWKKPIKPVAKAPEKPVEEKLNLDAESEWPEWPKLTVSEEGLNLVRKVPIIFDHAYGQSWGSVNWKPETMADRAQKMWTDELEQLEQLSPCQVMVKFAESEIATVHKLLDYRLRHLNNRIDQEVGYRNKLQDRVIEQGETITTLLTQLSELKAEKHRAYVEAITVKRAEGRLMREA